jgi:hypothetical protein
VPARTSGFVFGLVINRAKKCGVAYRAALGLVSFRLWGAAGLRAGNSNPCGGLLRPSQGALARLFLSSRNKASVDPFPYAES